MPETSEAMSAEFDTVADWTADAAIDLGADHYVAAGCRGSGSPSLLQWFVDELRVSASTRLLDVGAGVGGPAAFAHDQTGVRPVLSEPEPGACRSAARLFDLPVVRSDATALPFADGRFDVAWALGVLCTVPDQPRMLAELRRVVVPHGRLGLLVFVAAHDRLPDQPEGNNFPTDAALSELLAGAGLRVEASATSRGTSVEPPGWRQKVDAVEHELDRRHHDDPAWQTAQAQAGAIGRLIGADLIEPRAMILSAP